MSAETFPTDAERDARAIALSESDREAAAEQRGRVAALREAAEAAGTWRGNSLSPWLYARADDIEAQP